MRNQESGTAEKMFCRMATIGWRAYLLGATAFLLVVFVKVTDNLFNQSFCLVLGGTIAASLILFFIGLVGLFFLDLQAAKNVSEPLLCRLFRRIVSRKGGDRYGDSQNGV